MGKRMSLQICLRFLVIFGLVLGGILTLFHFGYYPIRLFTIGRSIESAYFYFQTLNLPLIVNDIDSTNELDEDAFDANLHYILMDENYHPVLSDEPLDQLRDREEDYKLTKEQYPKDARAVYENKSYGEQMVLRGKLMSAGQQFYLVIYRRTSLMHKYIQYAEKILINSMIMIWAIAVLILFLVVRKSTKPIQTFNEEVAAITDGNYTTRIDSNLRYEEYRESADRINDLAERLYSGKHELENYRYLIKSRRLVDTDEISRRRDLVAEVTHQLKTPLAIISSQLELEHEETDVDKKEYYYQSIMEEIDKLSILISQILRNAHDQAGAGVSFYPRHVSLSELLGELAPKYESWLRAQKILFHSEITPNVYAEADPMQVEIVVNNYLMNACKHTKPGKSILLRLIDEGDCCTIRVHNDGDGIPESNMSLIWNKYSQGSSEEGHSEVGLGLYIVKDIMSRHGGKYGVINDERGVEFYVSFLKEFQER